MMTKLKRSNPAREDSQSGPKPVITGCSKVPRQRMTILRGKSRPRGSSLTQIAFVWSGSEEVRCQSQRASSASACSASLRTR